MKFKTEIGKKSEKDKILISICPRCGRQERLLLIDLAKWMRFKARIERMAYPNGKKEEFLYSFLQRAISLNIEGKPIYTLRECCQLAELKEYENYDFADIEI